MDNKHPDIVGIGICTVDYLLTVPHMPLDGQSMRAREFMRQSGGLAASSLAAAARLGANAKIIARIGDDDDGQYIHDDLHNEGVDTSKLLVEPDSKSHISIILVDDHTGERSIISRWSTGSPIRVDEISQSDITSAKVLFIDDVTDATIQAVHWAKEAGVKVVMDPVQMFDVSQLLLSDVDVPIVPQHFAKDWMPDQPPEAVAQGLYDLGASIAIVTLGAKGCVVCSDEGVQRFPTFPVDVVDTTGAGDAFHGAFMVALLHDDWDIPQKVRFASAVGAMNCRALGGRIGLPTRQQVEEFLAAQ